jgi:hypothetical protein
LLLLSQALRVPTVPNSQGFWYWPFASPLKSFANQFWFLHHTFAD